MPKIIFTHYGPSVNFEIPHLMDEFGLNLESKIDSRKIDEIWKEAYRLDSGPPRWR